MTISPRPRSPGEIRSWSGEGIEGYPRISKEIWRVFQGFSNPGIIGLRKEMLETPQFQVLLLLRNANFLREIRMSKTFLDPHLTHSSPPFSGTPMEKLQWTFNLYDINGDGCITRDEMMEIIHSVYSLNADNGPEGPNGTNEVPQQHANRVFQVSSLCAFGQVRCVWRIFPNP